MNGLSGLFNPAVIVPLAAFMVPIVAIISGIVGQAHSRRLKAEQRIAMVQHGMSAEQIDMLLKSTKHDGEDDFKVRDPLRSLGNARRAGIVLVSVGVGLILFGVVLTAILGYRQTLSLAATGLVPLAIGIGFFVDYNLQKRELSRFGLEIGADLPPDNRHS